MEKYETHTHDVIVIGAGGAGLRAAIESSAQGASTGLICKSLLGKAHTVMAEGGVAAALSNVDSKDNWETHFKDTMKGGKMLNNWQMALYHAKEAPERVRELEYWGALFDRTKDGKINQRAFGGHTWKRLAHVGDRTGLEMIRTLQEKGIHSGHRCLHGMHHNPSHKGRRQGDGGFRLLEGKREVRSFPRKRNYSRNGWSRQGL